MRLKKFDLIFLFHTLAGEVTFATTFNLEGIETTFNQPLKYTSQIDKGADTNSVSSKADCSMEVCTVISFKDLSVRATFVVDDVG